MEVQVMKKPPRPSRIEFDDGALVHPSSPMLICKCESPGCG
jgi:hypothetical protein